MGVRQLWMDEQLATQAEAIALELGYADVDLFIQDVVAEELTRIERAVAAGRVLDAE